MWVTFTDTAKIEGDDLTRIATITTPDGNISSRPFTLKENAAADFAAMKETESGNKRTIEERAEAALVANTAYLALSAPLAADRNKQVELLTRQNNGIIRLLLGKLEATD